MRNWDGDLAAGLIRGNGSIPGNMLWHWYALLLLHLLLLLLLHLASLYGVRCRDQPVSRDVRDKRDHMQSSSFGNGGGSHIQ